ncbi:hypothetical protein Pmani_029232 [Petrolisthes manimaculis]|uniref:Uncharacterized protein n=1 Tax=Petrolisthes manimaculis TaxID=1843537 RepID=A0AAE1P0L8_9EUCA|nr:hypothetical protein Pmani_029232 [Petrolisthes manimaculis]
MKHSIRHLCYETLDYYYVTCVPEVPVGALGVSDTSPGPGKSRGTRQGGGVRGLKGASTLWSGCAGGRSLAGWLAGGRRQTNGDNVAWTEKRTLLRGYAGKLDLSKGVRQDRSVDTSERGGKVEERGNGWSQG